MAGNIVKWWKHKILGGYKQFSVQECTTDSEELMYHQVRASSSCSAPPDLLLVSDRENNIPLRSPVVNIITTSSSASSAAAAAAANAAATAAAAATASAVNGSSSAGVGGGGKQQQPSQHGAKDSSKHLKITSKNSGSSKLQMSTQMASLNAAAAHHHHQQQLQQDDCLGVGASADGAPQTQQSQSQTQHYQRHATHQQHAKEERIRLEEFTCDVSVEGGKSSQPLQFSFTFYDLDGHHGKITKDDIVGIVYTIYESIGKSVVVPHCGSKTINVRLTVSPEGKAKAAAAAAAASGSKLKRMPTRGGGLALGMLEHSEQAAHHNNKTHGGGAAGLTSGGGGGHHGLGHGHARRQHRYRPRKLIKSDDEDDDSNSEREKEVAATAAVAASAATTTTLAAATTMTTAATAPAGKSKNHASSKYNKIKMELQQCCQQRQTELLVAEQHVGMEVSGAVSCPHDSLYENMTANLKCCGTKDDVADECRGCSVAATPAPGAPVVAIADVTNSTTAGHHHHHHARSTDVYMKQASSRVKMLRKARKQKYQDHCLETRQRSLSVGSETCWKNRHAIPQQQQHTKHIQPPQEQFVDVVDGVQLRNPHKSSAAATAAMMMAQKRNSAECWKTALNRNDLITIIRESMEKNRLCFQLNGKPQANVSPIRQPQHHQHQSQHLPQSQHLTQHHRQRSNTVSKIPTLIANHNNSITNHTSSTTNTTTTNPNHHLHFNNSNNNNISNNNVSNNINNNSNNNNSHNNNNNNINSNSFPSNANNHPTSTTTNNSHNNNVEVNLHDISHNSHSNNSSLYHPQPHIPIYHQQMAINPAVLAAQTAQIGHSKINLCGYDSFLHATICGGGGSASHSPPPPAAQHQALQQLQLHPLLTVTSGGGTPSHHHHHHQPIAAVQPIMTATAVVPSLPKVFVNSTTNQIKTSKILRSGSYSAQAQHAVSATAHSSPQYHGYQRLSAGQQQQQSLAAAIRSPQSEPWLRCQKSGKDAKNNDNLLYAKLSEKLQENTLNVDAIDLCSNKENVLRRKPHHHHHKMHKRHHNHADQQPLRTTAASHAAGVAKPSDYIALIPLHGDPIECEHLLGQTSDEETSAELPTPTALVAGVPAVAGDDSARVDHETMNSGGGMGKGPHVATGKLIDLNDEAETVVELEVNRHVTVGIDDELERLVGDLGVEVDGDCDEEDDDEMGEGDDAEETASGASGSGSASVNDSPNKGTALANTSASSSSLIHRYVHEHIHHHYHHFEEKDEN